MNDTISHGKNKNIWTIFIRNINNNNDNQYDDYQDDLQQQKDEQTEEQNQQNLISKLQIQQNKFSEIQGDYDIQFEFQDLQLLETIFQLYETNFQLLISGEEVNYVNPFLNTDEFFTKEDLINMEQIDQENENDEQQDYEDDQEEQ